MSEKHNKFLYRFIQDTVSSGRRRLSGNGSLSRLAVMSSPRRIRAPSPALPTQSKSAEQSPEGSERADESDSTSTSHSHSTNALSSAARQIDKAMRYLLDSDQHRNDRGEEIWFMGVCHPAGAPDFSADFATRIWLTYRSGFELIRDVQLIDLPPPVATLDDSLGKEWAKEAEPPGAYGFSSDSGWGCMLRTGQSLLANALMTAWFGRDWKRIAQLETHQHALYVHLLSLFLDTPHPTAPFSIHRMALAGKQLGKDIGQWFGPSTAAGAIKNLVSAYPLAGIGVVVGMDGALSKSEVFTASYSQWSDDDHALEWGDRPVLVLLNLRLGLDRVNPIYHDTIKALFTFPQSVGIAGGRPCSSYHFVGAQGSDLIYLDPHHTRPAVHTEDSTAGEREEEDAPKRRSHFTIRRSPHKSASPQKASSPRRVVPSPPRSPSPASSPPKASSPLSTSPNTRSPLATMPARSPPASPSPPPRLAIPTLPSPGSGEPRSLSTPTLPASPPMSPISPVTGTTAPSLPAALQTYYQQSFTAADLATFHCTHPRMMPVTALDPSMLAGFLCRDIADWDDWRARVARLPKQIMSIQEGSAGDEVDVSLDDMVLSDEDDEFD
ncbi:peptidase family C54-domain-containing protein [Schizophyllum amplum]|uniref:Cysteine protease n=1 Tax=Schizophyllum amplum TaxID=97359 RepID=A0A550CJQ4_9AGAR|nr:peptidase family C54-domain-containing protein [Auriculariopsis ampla]